MNLYKFKYSLNPVQVLWRNKTRTFLTSLGIIIGIASVIIIISVGAGAQTKSGVLVQICLVFCQVVPMKVVGQLLLWVYLSLL